MFFNKTPTTKIDDPDTGKKVLDWWKETVLLLGDTQITDKLVNFDKESITEKLIKDIEPFLAQDSFKPEALASAS